MSQGAVIVCYHRVLAPGDATGKPYLARGTAVTEATFVAQMDAIASAFEVLGEHEFLAWHRGERELTRPGCWITFDDGYKDVAVRAVPILAARGMTASAFVTTSTLTDRTAWLPADAWYAVLNRAEAKGREITDYARLVDGPERRAYLHGPAEERTRALEELASMLGVSASGEPGDLYMSEEDVRGLVRRGWTVGGHGHTHAILTTIPPDQLRAELEASRDALRRLGLPPETLAYPDGAHVEPVVASVSDLGWKAGLALGDRAASRGAPVLTLPRFLSREDPSWVGRVLLPSVRN